MKQPIVIIAWYIKARTSTGSYTYPRSEPDAILTDFKDLTIRYGIDNSKDTIGFSLLNHRERQDSGEYSFLLNTDPYQNLDTRDLIKIYAYHEPLDITPFPGEQYNTALLRTLEANNKLLLSAYIKSWSYNSTEGVGKLTLDSYNRSEALLNSMMFAVFNQGEQVPNMIVSTLERIKTYDNANQVFALKDYSGLAQPGERGGYNSSGIRQMYYINDDGLRKYIPYYEPIPSNCEPAIGYIRAYKKSAYDDSGELLYSATDTVAIDDRFTNVVYTQTYKPFLDHLNEISTPAYTKDDDAGLYISYLDNENNLYWIPKDFTLGYTLREDEASSIDFNRDVDEIINAVILNCGQDPAGNGVLALAYNPESMAANGSRWKYMSNTTLMDNIKKKERESTNLGGNNYGKTFGDDEYPGSFPWIVQHTASDSFHIPPQWTYTGGSTTVANKADYKEYVRRVARDLGKRAGENLVKYNGEPLFSGKYEFPEGIDAVRPGMLVKLQLSSIKVKLTEYDETLKDYKYLRVVSVSHSFSTSWKTTLELKEDLDFNQLMGVVNGI